MQDWHKSNKKDYMSDNNSTNVMQSIILGNCHTPILQKKRIQFDNWEHQESMVSLNLVI